MYSSLAPRNPLATIGQGRVFHGRAERIKEKPSSRFPRARGARRARKRRLRLTRIQAIPAEDGNSRPMSGPPTVCFSYSYLRFLLLGRQCAFTKQTSDGQATGRGATSANQGQSHSSQHQGQSSTSSSFNGNQGPEKGSRPSHRKRKRDDSPDPGGSSKRQVHGDGPSPDAPFVCPFYVSDKARYADCLMKKLRRIGDVCQHIERAHVPKYYCPTCLETFTAASGKDAHINEWRCQRRSVIQAEADVDQWNRFNDRGSLRGTTDEAKWLQLWAILFPAPAFTEPSRSAIRIYKHPLVHGVLDQVNQFLSYFTREGNVRRPVDPVDFLSTFRTFVANPGARVDFSNSHGNHGLVSPNWSTELPSRFYTDLIGGPGVPVPALSLNPFPQPQITAPPGEWRGGYEEPDPNGLLPVSNLQTNHPVLPNEPYSADVLSGLFSQQQVFPEFESPGGPRFPWDLAEGIGDGYVDCGRPDVQGRDDEDQ
ncbi:hypothetical protein F4780DRAFT_761085 [Xylariomycetidae sp. FL0641]|nr:hypothetical protein F4780DRAFT_761085 [Xylariomycetidae sp. FL0641]